MESADQVRTDGKDEARLVAPRRANDGPRRTSRPPRPPIVDEPEPDADLERYVELC